MPKKKKKTPKYRHQIITTIVDVLVPARYYKQEYFKNGKPKKRKVMVPAHVIKRKVTKDIRHRTDGRRAVL